MDNFREIFATAFAGFEVGFMEVLQLVMTLGVVIAIALFKRIANEIETLHKRVDSSNADIKANREKSITELEHHRSQSITSREFDVYINLFKETRDDVRDIKRAMGVKGDHGGPP